MNWMIYGANGYTGRLIAVEAARRGMRPVVAGRNQQEVEDLAAVLDLPSRCFDLAESARLERELEEVDVLLHCAGPFSATGLPMLQACLASGCHYLDITGEIDWFEQAWSMSDRARRADVVVCPGVGFDVVPTDCLAASLVERLPAATELTLAFAAGGGPSPGTARTSLEGMAKGGRVRRDGKIQKVPIAWKTRTIPFARGPRKAVTIPWGDVFTAWVSTGVPNIEVYLAASPAALRQMRMLRLLRPLLAAGWLRDRLQRRIDARVSGPDEEQRRRNGTEVWGEVRSADGRSITGTVTGPNGYDFTVLGSLGMVEQVLSYRGEGGYFTPSLLAGAGFAATLPGVSLQIEN